MSTISVLILTGSLAACGGEGGDEGMDAGGLDAESTDARPTDGDPPADADPTAPDATTIDGGGGMCAWPGGGSVVGSIGGHTMSIASSRHTFIDAEHGENLILEEAIPGGCYGTGTYALGIVFPCNEPVGAPANPGTYTVATSGGGCPAAYVQAVFLDPSLPGPVPIAAIASSGTLELTGVGPCWTGTFSFTMQTMAGGSDAITGDFTAVTCTP